tara:strand:- start:997 stop:1425 length:429 start_codon:yes stop_codon:yes gene_type:complete
MAGLKPMFNLGAIKNYMQDQINEIADKSIQALEYEGELFINKARQTGNYSDRTGNLRSSIGYIILQDGKEVKSSFIGTTNDGTEQGYKTAREVALDYPKGMVLIGVAGMGYAAAVESRGYDVITGSAPNSNDIKDLLGAIKL